MSEGASSDQPRHRWVKAVALAVTALALGGIAATKSASLALATSNPALALRFDRANSLALGQAALRDIQVARTPAQGERAVMLARRAIARDATNATALGVIGLNGSGVAVRKALVASEHLSRRSLPTQLGLIEAAVARNDVDQALRHYDIALRTSRGAPSILFPVLVAATDDAALLPGIARTLVARPPWGPVFTQHLAQVGGNLTNIARLFGTMFAAGVDPSVASANALYARLIEAKRFDDAWHVYARANPGAARAAIRNGRFGDASIDPTPFDWTLSQEGPVTAQIVTADDGKGGRLSFTSRLGEGGLAARQLLLLPPGRHQLRATVDTLKAPSDAVPYLQIECSGGTEIARLPLARPGEAAANFVLPSNCGSQSLSLYVPTPATSEVIEGSIALVALR